MPSKPSSSSHTSMSPAWTDELATILSMRDWTATTVDLVPPTSDSNGRFSESRTSTDKRGMDTAWWALSLSSE